jgi:hypothetical protein
MAAKAVVLGRGGRIGVLSAIVVVAFVGGCGEANGPLPEPAVRWDPVPATMTPIPPPHPACIAQMGRPPGSKPRKPRHVSPRFPETSARTHLVSTRWFGVAQVDTEGRVVNVRTVRAPEMDPPSPAVNDAFVDAIRQWRYEPTCVDGQPIETELSIVAMIHL